MKRLSPLQMRMHLTVLEIISFVLNYHSLPSVGQIVNTNMYDCFIQYILYTATRSKSRTQKILLCSVCKDTFIVGYLHRYNMKKSKKLMIRLGHKGKCAMFVCNLYNIWKYSFQVIILLHQHRVHLRYNIPFQILKMSFYALYLLLEQKQ